MEHQNWSCPKCANRSYTTGEMRVSGGFWARLFLAYPVITHTHYM